MNPAICTYSKEKEIGETNFEQPYTILMLVTGVILTQLSLCGESRQKQPCSPDPIVCYCTVPSSLTRPFSARTHPNIHKTRKVKPSLLLLGGQVALRLEVINDLLNSIGDSQIHVLDIRLRLLWSLVGALIPVNSLIIPPRAFLYRPLLLPRKKKYRSLYYIPRDDWSSSWSL